MGAYPAPAREQKEARSLVNPPVPATALTNLLNQVARRVHAQAHTLDLFPAQWAALRYMARMPADLRTSSDLARFQGQEHGSVARTVRTLIDKGYLETAGPVGRGRATALELTEDGRKLLLADPLLKVQGVFDRFDGAERETIARFLEETIRTLQSDTTE
jgi:DNA-binding MarR family transcriptional regulator